MTMAYHSPDLLQAIAAHAQEHPARRALIGARGELDYATLRKEIDTLAARLAQANPKVLGLAMDNDPAWAVSDLAAMKLALPLVPLPGFFSAAQTVHAIEDSGISHLLCDQPIRVQEMLTKGHATLVSSTQLVVAGKHLTLMQLAIDKTRPLPADTAKLTYTSGTTGHPKGVCLSLAAQMQVAGSLWQATAADAEERHLSILPLGTLLENIAGIYVPLLAGACTTLLPAHQVGLSGSSGLDVARMMQTLHQHQPTTLVLTPELLQVLVTALEQGCPPLSTLRFVAVGGAPVSMQLLTRAAQSGIPVYEGYGLSECSSVVAVNRPGAHKPGTVGKPLPHAHLHFASDGEIFVQGATLIAYTGDWQPAPRLWPTGDIGHLDADGYLHITGRKKHMFITSYGRNVAPEWVERELVLTAPIAQAALFGEGRPWNTAVIVPRMKDGQVAQIEEIEQAVLHVNAGLPDYARIGMWVFAETPFTVDNGQLTPNGRLRRAQIWQRHAPKIVSLYEESINAVL